MPQIVAGYRSLVSARRTFITKVLQRVSNHQLYVHTAGRGTSLRFTVKAGTQPSDLVQDWTFPSLVDGMVCQYREVWLSQDPPNSDYKFHSVYFHLLRSDGAGSALTEFAFFHWHPSSPPQTPTKIYNQLPHFHVKVGGSSIGKVHLVSTLTASPNSANSMAYLDRLLDEAVSLMADEML